MSTWDERQDALAESHYPDHFIDSAHQYGFEGVVIGAETQRAWFMQRACADYLACRLGVGVEAVERALADLCRGGTDVEDEGEGVR